jgi:predicted phage terminase large subunit-like protein
MRDVYVDLSGNIVKRPFTYARLKEGYSSLDGEMIPEGGFRFLSVDLAGTAKRRSDRTAMLICDVTSTTPRRLIVRDARTMKLDTEAHEETIVQYAKDWDCRFIGVEEKTFGINLVNRLIARGGVNVLPFPANDAKELRALPLASGIRNKIIWFLEGAEYIGSLEDELVKFPTGKYDDQLDALAHAYLYFLTLPSRRLPEYEPETPAEHAAALIKAKRLNANRSSRTHPLLGRVR